MRITVDKEWYKEKIQETVIVTIVLIIMCIYDAQLKIETKEMLIIRQFVLIFSSISIFMHDLKTVSNYLYLCQKMELSMEGIKIAYPLLGTKTYLWADFQYKRLIKIEDDLVIKYNEDYYQKVLVLENKRKELKPNIFNHMFDHFGYTKRIYIFMGPYKLPAVQRYIPNARLVVDEQELIENLDAWNVKVEYETLNKDNILWEI